MRITDIKTVLLTGPYSADPYILACRPRRSAAFVEIHTDAGIVGVGETYAGYFFPESVPGIVEFFAPILIGQSPDDVEVLWQRMARASSPPCPASSRTHGCASCTRDSARRMRAAIRAGSTNLRAGSPRSPQTRRSRMPFTMNARFNNLTHRAAGG